MTAPLLIPLLSLLLLCGSAQADSIETIQLHNRPAAEVIPIIQPMLDAGGSVTGQGFQVFVRSSEQNLAQIRQLVEKLDTAARQLLISVFQGSERDLRALAMSGGFRYQDDNTDIRVGSGGRPPRGADVTYSTRGAAVSGNVLSTRGRLSDNPIHQLRVSEGSPGYIETGASIPYFAGSVWLGGRRPPVVEADVDYKDVTTGFYVLPRVHGELEIEERGRPIAAHEQVGFLGEVVVHDADTVQPAQQPRGVSKIVRIARAGEVHGQALEIVPRPGAQPVQPRA